MNNPKVSVIIPVYNRAKYLQECLDSVLIQTLEDIEIICINDGSTDDSYQILMDYEQKDRRIIILNQNNQGVASSRNNGLKIAKGEFVIFMDSDDFYPESDILECLYAKAKTHHVMICGGSFSHSKNGDVISNYTGDYKDYAFHEEGKIVYSEYQFHFGFTRFMYDLQFLRRERIEFPLYTRYEDPPFLVKAMMIAGEFYSIPKITYCYRVGYKSNVVTAEMAIDWAKGILDLLRVSKEHGLSKLHNLTIQTSRADLYPAMYKHISEGNVQLCLLATEINDSIEIEYLFRSGHPISENYLLALDDINNYVKEAERKEYEFLRYARKFDQIILYGAGNIGVKVAEYFQQFKEINILSFAVSEKMNNLSEILGITVQPITELTPYKQSSLVIVSTALKFHEEIKITLSQLGFKYILLFDPQLLKLFRLGAGKDIEIS
ncbi:glycosyltransferase family 2 protein [Paenibacillus amylolyticus]|uniref:glycosyltransferase family 2 protein n=1 Tax=Paenibacillus amylolyticus TaxID=1451 RepID=UPI003EBE2803